MCRLLLPACSRLQRVYTFTKRKKILRNYDALELIGVTLMSLLDVTMTLEKLIVSHITQGSRDVVASCCVESISPCQCLRSQNIDLLRSSPKFRSEFIARHATPHRTAPVQEGRQAADDVNLFALLSFAWWFEASNPISTGVECSCCSHIAV